MNSVSYTCLKCEGVVSHPSDRCPICGNFFYWRLKVQVADPSQWRGFYRDELRQFLGREPDEGYIFKDQWIYLPAGYWEKDPEGAWVSRLPGFQSFTLVQYQSKKPQPLQTRVTPQKTEALPIVVPSNSPSTHPPRRQSTLGVVQVKAPPTPVQAYIKELCHPLSLTLFFLFCAAARVLWLWHLHP
jgi:hypothetical protein